MGDGRMLAEKDGAIGRMVFDNPARRNAISLAMWESAERILAEFAADDRLRVIVVSGAGDQAFASGADVSKFEDERASAEEVARYTAAIERVFARLDDSRKPIIAMIRGYCLGGGLTVALGCDLRICSEDSSFGIPAARLGIGYTYANVRRLVGVVGPAFAKEILFTGRRFDADQARAMGLVNRVVSVDALAATVKEYADTIAGNAPLSVTAGRTIVGEIVKDPAERDRALCDSLVRACFESADYVEGRRAFLEKRQPVFAGR